MFVHSSFFHQLLCNFFTGDRRKEDGVRQAGSVREEGEEGERRRQEGTPEAGGRGDNVGQDVLAGRLVRAGLRRDTRLQVAQTGEKEFLMLLVQFMLL